MSFGSAGTNMSMILGAPELAAGFVTSICGKLSGLGVE
jgi:hypothetical protein